MARKETWPKIKLMEFYKRSQALNRSTSTAWNNPNYNLKIRQQEFTKMPQSSLVSRRTLGAKSASNRSRKSSEKFADFRLSAKRVGQASAFLKALGHESRLLILCLLGEGEKT